ncbi:CDP-alcohol phosphatidyltransferase family protein [Schumannella soli]|uniref:VTT domain-containing protein n=1 Tax=Schumannella soli TaxID=2590779 RepID=A0A506XXA5_9MICO|nr:CDP-alcohol phosphatidyltransferase family protein [Schumannella soli]TPW77391.1 hypothetical protein FJ657_01505 [Schumannella soli]
MSLPAAVATPALPDPLTWGLGALFAFLDNGVGLGFHLPGEGVILLLSAAITDVVPAIIMFVAVTIGACAGDHLGYLLGRRHGAGLRDRPLVRRLGLRNWDRALATLERRGGLAIYLTRLVPIVRTLTPLAAGVARVRYSTFLVASLLGAATWALVYVGAGFLLRASLDAVRDALGDGGYLVLAGIAAAAVIALLVRAVRRTHATAATVIDAVASATARASAPVEADVPRVPLFTRLFRQDEWRTWPNLISLVRLLLLPVFLVLIIVEQYWAAIVLIAIVFSTDWVDGWLARRTGTVSELGKWLDPLADRFTTFAVVMSLAAGGLIPWSAVVLLVVPDLTLGILSVTVFDGDPNLPVTWTGKIRTALLFVGLLAVLLGTALVSSGVAAIGAAIIGSGFVLFLCGVVGHYLAAAQYGRAMIVRKTGWVHAA